MWKKFKNIERSASNSAPSFAENVINKEISSDNIEYLTRFIWYDKRGQYLHMVHFDAKKSSNGKLCQLSAPSTDVIITGNLIDKCGQTLQYKIEELTDIQYDIDSGDLWLETPFVGILLRDPLPEYHNYFAALKHGFKMLATKKIEEREEEENEVIAEMHANNLVPVPPPRMDEHVPRGDKMGPNFVNEFPPIDVVSGTCQSGVYVKDMHAMKADIEYFKRFIIVCDRGPYLYMTQFEARKKGKLSTIVAPSKDTSLLGTLENGNGEKLTYRIQDIKGLLYDPSTEDLWVETSIGTLLLREPGPNYRIFFQALKTAHKKALANGGSAFCVM